MAGPLISVVMSVYNCEKTLPEALESITLQTYQNWELIVCDDASTDGTGALLDAFKRESPQGQVTVLNNTENRKLAFSLNRCLSLASGTIIARMDGDDISLPTRFEEQMRFLDENAGVDLVGTSMRRFSANGLGDVVAPASMTPTKWTLAYSTRAPFCHATILAKREVFEKVQGYTVSWRTERGQDLDLWFKFYAAGFTGQNLPDPLYLVREDSAAIRRRSRKSRIGGFATRVKGARALNFPPLVYARYTLHLMKVFVPYSIFDLHRAWSRGRSSLSRLATKT